MLHKQSFKRVYLDRNIKRKRNLVPRINTHIIVVELACITKVLAHANTTINAILLRLKVVKISTRKKLSFRRSKQSAYGKIPYIIVADTLIY